MKISENVTMENIKIVMKETGVVYETAENVLKKNFNDTQTAIMVIRRKSKSPVRRVGEWFYGILKYKLVIRNRKVDFIRLPLWLVALLVITLYINGGLYRMSAEIFSSVLLILFVIIIITNCEILITNREEKESIQLIRKTSEDEFDEIEKEYEVTEDDDGMLGIEVNE